MNETIEKFEVRDFRRKEFFQVDDAYLNGFARLCGIYATGVYLSLCRHANKSQTSFPSVKLISEELAISEDSVTKAIKILTEHKIIQYEKKRTDMGVFLSNVYILLDKKHWTIATHTAVSGMDIHTVDSGMDRGYTHTAVSGTKDTQRLKDTHKDIVSIRIDTATSSKKEEVAVQPNAQNVLKEFTERFEKKFGNKPMYNFGRDGKLAKELLKVYGLDKLKNLINVFFSQGTDFTDIAGFSFNIFYSQINRLISLSSQSDFYTPEEQKAVDIAKEQMRLMGKL